ncbi:hydroxyacid dehydrogenase [Acidimangrovimonas pyrenivorans]|uniref:Hydroxyacid dehydrogenase n=1 Tax=Acidimangrovimonas pyrenivorans TaxID=2030798 RepID=A0ABV7AFK5_9RHOB
MPRILVTEPIHDDAVALLREAGCEITSDAPLDEVDAVIVRTDPIPAGALAPGRLKVISKHGVGVDNIPLEAARAAGIAVTNTPGANAGSVAEHALMLMLALAKALPAMQRAARAGGLPDPAAQVIELAGRRLLVAGYGQSGKRLASLAAALGMRVTVWSRSLKGATTPEGYTVAPDFRAALPQSDVVSLHLPLVPETRGMLGAAELALLPRGALVINTGRGGLIDEAALLAADHLGGFGLDVVAGEPIRPDNPLLRAPNGIVTPHSAAMTGEAFRNMGMMAARNVLDALAGRADPTCLVVPPPG